MSGPTEADFRKSARERLTGKTRDELIYIKDGGGRDGWEKQVALDMIQEMDHAAVMERLKSIEEPHWTTTPGFWVAVGGFLLAGLAAWFAWLALPRLEHQDASPTPSSLSTPPSTTPPSPAKSMKSNEQDATRQRCLSSPVAFQQLHYRAPCVRFDVLQ
jgi:hypothetical protein